MELFVFDVYEKNLLNWFLLMAQRTKHLQILQHNFMNGGSHTLSNSFKYEHNDQEMQNDLLFRIEIAKKIRSLDLKSPHLQQLNPE